MKGINFTLKLTGSLAVLASLVVGVIWPMSPWFGLTLVGIVCLGMGTMAGGENE